MSQGFILRDRSGYVWAGHSELVPAHRQDRFDVFVSRDVAQTLADELNRLYAWAGWSFTVEELVPIPAPLRANTCPYCGGRYTIEESCTGPRTDNPWENTCREMALHRLLVRAAADTGVREDEE